MAKTIATGNNALQAWIQRHAKILFIASSYLLAWCLWLPLLGRDLGDSSALSPDFLILAMAGGLMPSFSALILRIIGGNSIYSDNSQKQSIPFYVLKLAGIFAIVPSLTLIGIMLQIIFKIPFDPGDILSRVAIGIGWPLMAAFGEEFGWRGTLLPLFNKRFSLLSSALLVGIVWGFWHLPADWIGLKSHGIWFWPQFLLQGPVLLTAHSLIMTWIWQKTKKRILPAIVYHFTLTGSAILFGNQAAGIEGSIAFTGNVIMATVIIAAASLAAFAIRRHRPQHTESI